MAATLDVVSHETAFALSLATGRALLRGAGVRGAHAEGMELAGKLHSPVGHSLRGKEWIQYDNPYDVGMSGLFGYGACCDAMHQADLLLLLGTDFPYDDFLPQARTVQVDHDAARLGRRTPALLSSTSSPTPTPCRSRRISPGSR